MATATNIPSLKDISKELGKMIKKSNDDLARVEVISRYIRQHVQQCKRDERIGSRRLTGSKLATKERNKVGGGKVRKPKRKAPQALTSSRRVIVDADSD